MPASWYWGATIERTNAPAHAAVTAAVTGVRRRRRASSSSSAMRARRAAPSGRAAIRARSAATSVRCAPFCTKSALRKRKLPRSVPRRRPPGPTVTCVTSSYGVKTDPPKRTDRGCPTPPVWSWIVPPPRSANELGSGVGASPCMLTAG